MRDGPAIAVIGYATTPPLVLFSLIAVGFASSNALRGGAGGDQHTLQYFNGNNNF